MFDRDRSDRTSSQRSLSNELTELVGRDCACTEEERFDGGRVLHGRSRRRSVGAGDRSIIWIERIEHRKFLRDGVDANVGSTSTSSGEMDFAGHAWLTAESLVGYEMADA